MKTKYPKLKQELKDLAASIRHGKSKRKSHTDGLVPGLYSDQYVYRHKHIVYCMLHGRDLSEIENHNRPGNEPSKHLLETYRKEYALTDTQGEVQDEALCDIAC